jgi:hypothetical protein
MDIKQVREAVAGQADRARIPRFDPCLLMKLALRTDQW